MTSNSYLSSVCYLCVYFCCNCVSIFVSLHEFGHASAEHIRHKLWSINVSTYPLPCNVDWDPGSPGVKLKYTIWSRIQRLWAGHSAVSLCQAETGLLVMQTAGSLRTAMSQMLSWWSWGRCWRRQGGGRQHLKGSIQRYVTFRKHTEEICHVSVTSVVCWDFFKGSCDACRWGRGGWWSRRGSDFTSSSSSRHGKDGGVCTQGKGVFLYNSLVQPKSVCVGSTASLKQQQNAPSFITFMKLCFAYLACCGAMPLQGDLT